MYYLVIKLVDGKELKVDYNGDLKVLRITVDGEDVAIDKVNLEGVACQTDLRIKCKMHFETEIYENLKETVRSCLDMDLDEVALKLGPTENAVINVLLNYEDLMCDLTLLVMKMEGKPYVG